MELSKRMQMLVDMVPKGTRLADIGCDHGFVSIHLVEQGICPNVIAADLREGPLAQAREHVQEAGLVDRIDLRISDGLTAIRDGEVDGFLAAGMGGRVIRHMIESDLVKVRAMAYMILQPQSEIAELRAFLRENDFQIMNESMVCEDGKYYPAMLIYIGRVKVTPRPKSDDEDEYITLQGIQEFKPDRQFYYERLLWRLEELEEQEKKTQDYEEVSNEKLSHAGDAEQAVVSDLVYSLMANEIGDHFGPVLITEKHPVLAEYLTWWEGKQLQILEAIYDTHGAAGERGILDHSDRIEDVNHELELIHMTQQLMRL